MPVFRSKVSHANAARTADTSEKSKENSKKVIDSLGGDAAHYGDQDQPRTKTAAENIDGSRAMLQ